MGTGRFTVLGWPAWSISVRLMVMLGLENLLQELDTSSLDSVGGILSCPINHPLSMLSDFVFS